MSSNPVEIPVRYCGRLFTAEDLQRIRDLLLAHPEYNRVQLSRRVCRELGWLRPDGRPKEMSCRVAMLRMHREGIITLPPPQSVNGNGRCRLRLTPASDPREPITRPAGRLDPLCLHPVQTPAESSLWNELIHRYHYLGYKPLPGAQLRYLVFAGTDLLAALGFAAAAWKVAPRDQWIRWTPPQRQQNLHLVVNNARFLILPWVRSPNLASRILATAARQLPADWLARYGYQPVLLETFVQTDRFHGTCYRAANWISVGLTQGRGKLDQHHLHPLPTKEIFLYPLHKHFRLLLCNSQ